MASDDPAGARYATARPRQAARSAPGSVPAVLGSFALWLERRSALARVGMILAVSALIWSGIAALLLA